MTALDLAIDAQALVGSTTGIGHYTDGIITGLANIDQSNRFHLPYFWSPRRRRPPLAERPSNFRYRRIPIPMPVVVTLDRLGLPPRWDHFYRRLDACLFTGGTARPLKRGANVRVIYDIAYLLHPETLPSATIARRWADNVRSTLPAMSGLVVISEAVRTEVCDQFGVSKNDVVVAPPGVDREVFYRRDPSEVETIRREYGLDRPYVLHVGMQEPRKNIPTLVRSVAQIPEARRGDLELVLAGPPAWGSPDITAAINEVGAHGVTVRELGFVTASDLAALYSGASAFAFPSIYEGFGMPLLEAMACETPVVAGTSAALREVSGGTATHVDPNDEPALAAAIRERLDSTQDVSQGLERSRTYTWARAAGSVHELLLRVVGDH